MSLLLLTWPAISASTPILTHGAIIPFLPPSPFMIFSALGSVASKYLLNYNLFSDGAVVDPKVCGPLGSAPLCLRRWQLEAQGLPGSWYSIGTKCLRDDVNISMKWNIFCYISKQAPTAIRDFSLPSANFWVQWKQYQPSSNHQPLPPQ